MTSTVETVAAAFADGELDMTVDRARALADDVIELVLCSPAPLAAWQPGAHIDLVLGPQLVRQYSLCGDPRDLTSYRIAVLHEPAGRGGSAYIHEQLQQGQPVTVRGPRNHFPLRPASRYQFIAGGIGITPILSMIFAAERAGADWNLLYGGRRRQSMAYLTELEQYGDRVRIQPEDSEGPLDLDSVLSQPHEGTLVYCCGPEPLLEAVEERCAAWPVGTLHVERFTASSGDPDAVDSQFEVEFARSGVTATVAPGISILDAAIDQGLFVLRSCGEGVCGTCETVLLEGDPDHRDSVLSQEDRDAGCFIPCVSRCRSERLVLDL